MTYIESENVFLIGLDVNGRETARQDLDGYFMGLFGIVLGPSVQQRYD